MASGAVCSQRYCLAVNNLPATLLQVVSGFQSTSDYLQAPQVCLQTTWLLGWQSEQDACSYMKPICHSPVLMQLDDAIRNRFPAPAETAPALRCVVCMHPEQKYQQVRSHKPA